MRTYVCHVNLSKELRGGERQTVALIQALSRQVAQRIVLRRGSPLHETLARQCWGAELVPIDNSVLQAIRCTAGAQVVHVHEGRSVLVGAARTMFGTPFVVTRRIIKQPKRNVATRWCYGRATILVGVSAAVAKAMRGYDTHCAARVVYDCAPALPSADSRFVSAVRCEFPGRVLVGQVGQLDDATKGQRTTLAAARALEKTRPEIIFLMIGSGPDEFELRAEAAGLSNVRFVGWTSHIADYYAALDVLVFPSRSEALGSAMLEAMSFGVPVVASAVGGIPEVVEHEINGLLFPDADASALCRDIERLVADGPLREALSRGARHTAASLSPDWMAKQYLDIYAAVISGREPSTLAQPLVVPPEEPSGLGSP